MVGKKVGMGVLATVATLAVAVPCSAYAATTLGVTPPPRGTVGNCIFGLVDAAIVGTSGDGFTYTVPANGGVITEWRHYASASAGQALALRVFTRQAPTTFTAVVQTQLEPITPGQLNTFPVRVPVSGGELIGLRNGGVGASSAACVYAETGNALDEAYFREPAEATGTSATYNVLNQYLVNVAVQLEADADGDGFGDETQDQCPTDASTQGPCPDTDPPETTITKGAPNKLDKSKVKFKFTSDEPDSTFECKVDGKPFKPCTSPRKVKRLDEGKHKFKVRAIDAAGNVDPSAAKDKFKVVG